MQEIRRGLEEGAFILDLKARDLQQVVHRAVDFVVARNWLAPENHHEVEQALLSRERQSSTAIGHAVALPHAYLDALTRPVILFVRLERPLNLGAPDGIPTRFFFFLLGPTTSVSNHLDTLANLARLMADEEFRYEAGQAENGQQLLEAFEHFHHRAAPPPDTPAEPQVSEGLQYTGGFAGGVLADIQRRLPHYLSDFRDGLSTKCVASILFLFFACLAPAITFGGVMAVGTGGHIGPVEMLAATALCGVVFALLAGQPLIVLGGTGPLLIFTAILYRLCTDLGIPFLPAYACIGLWTAAILLVLALTEASVWMRYFTRFTDEIFAALISLIFIYEAVHALAEMFFDVYRQEGISHDSAFLALILALGTFFIALNLSRFRRSKYLLPRVREFLTDFGPTISLGLMTAVAMWFRGDVEVEVLAAPDTFGPTLEGRAWLLNPFHPDLPRIVWLIAPVPALFAAILIYLDQNITGRIINSPQHKLQKGEAYHLDLAVVGGLVAVCSLFGLPWLVAATVRSLNHLRSLATVEEAVLSNGETRERTIHVQENRVTGLSIHLLIGLSLLLLPVLKMIPMAVLYGIFLYMGVVSIKGNQFFERLNLWLTDPSLRPSTHYSRRVPLGTIHRFTLIQLACLAVLWLVKTGPSVVAILFPVVIALLAPIRLLIGRFFAPRHLAALDGEEDPEL